jgi:hypothetical protein
LIGQRDIEGSLPVGSFDHHFGRTADQHHRFAPGVVVGIKSRQLAQRAPLYPLEALGQLERHCGGAVGA